MRRSDGSGLFVVVSVCLLLGAMSVPADATAVQVVASAAQCAGVGLLVASLAICVRIFREGRRKS